jgi:hypothetical protein
MGTLESTSQASNVLTRLLTKVEEVYEKYQAEERVLAKEYTSTCYKGCGTCCHFPIISATAGEAFVLYNLLAHMSSNLEGLNSHLRAYAARYLQYAKSEGSLPFTQAQQKKAFSELKLPCPLFHKTGENGEGHCGAFAARPLICGYFHSLDSPELCAKKAPHRTYAPAIAAGEEAMEELRTFERMVLGRSTLGHLPLLLAAMSHAKGQNALLKTEFANAETNALPPEEAQWSYDFDLFIELLQACGYDITETDIHSLLEAQKEIGTSS